MRTAILFAAAAIGLGFPAGLGLAVYMATGSTLAPPAASASVPTGTIAEPSLETTGVDISGNCDEFEHRNDPECLPGAGGTIDDTTTGETTTDETTTDETTTTETEVTETDGDSSGKGRGRGRGRGRGGDD
jgi:hypothetical protein